MRLSDLLGLDVLDAANTYVGTVADLRLVQDGAPLGPYGAALRLSGLIVVEHRHVRLLGYERDVGPWFLRWLVHRLTGRVSFIPWDAVQSIDAAGVHASGFHDRYDRLSDLPDRRNPGSR